MRVLLLLLVPLVHGGPLQEQLEVGTAEDAEVLRQMVKDLFSDRDGREIEVEDEESEATDISTNLASSEPNEGKSTASLVEETDPIEIARFNSYMDAIYRRMNAALRAKLMDPMILNLDGNKNKKKSHHKERQARREEHHNISKRDAEEEEDELVEVDRMGEMEGQEDEVMEVEETEDGTGRKMDKQKNKVKKNKNGKKNKPKATDEQKKKKSKGKGGKGKKKNSGKGKGKKSHGGHKGKKADHDEKKGKKADHDEKKGKKAEHGEKKGKKADHGKKDKKGDGALERSRRNKHSNDKAKGKGKGGKSNDDQSSGGKSMGSLAGIATLRRSRDVVVMNSDSHKVVKSDFTIGPLQLEVSKTFGKGQSRSVKTAKAVTDELAGKMVLKVKPDGSAYVKSVFFHKPEKVEVRGSLGNQKKRSDTYLKNSVGKVRPMAAQRILKMARYVLKSPSTVERS